MSVFRYNTTTYKVKNIRKARDNCNEMPEVFIIIRNGIVLDSHTSYSRPHSKLGTIVVWWNFCNYLQPWRGVDGLVE